jgi:hypothetical protein
MQFCHSHFSQMRETPSETNDKRAPKPQTVEPHNKLPSPASSEAVQPNRPNCNISGCAERSAGLQTKENDDERWQRAEGYA